MLYTVSFQVPLGGVYQFVMNNVINVGASLILHKLLIGLKSTCFQADSVQPLKISESKQRDFHNLATQTLFLLERQVYDLLTISKVNF